MRLQVSTCCHNKIFLAIYCLILIFNLTARISFADDYAFFTYIYPGNSASVNGIALSPNGKYLVIWGDDGIIHIWNIQTGRELHEIKAHLSSVISVAISKDSKLFASGSKDKTAKLWDMETAKNIQLFKGHSEFISSVDISRDRKFLFTKSGDKTAKLWNIKTGKEIHSFNNNSFWEFPVMFSPDGKYIIEGGGKIVRLRDIQIGTEKGIFEGHSSTILSLDITPDGKNLLTGSVDRTVRLWDIPTGKELRKFETSSKNISVVIFPNSKYFVTGGSDSTAKLYDIESGRELVSFLGHSDVVRSIAISPESKILLTGSRDKTAKIWNLETGNELATLHLFKEGGWAVISFEGYFDCSDGANKYINFHQGKDAYPVEKYYKNYHRSGLLADLMHYSSKRQGGVITGIVSDKDDGWPVPAVNIRIEGTLIGGTTNFEGRYIIRNLPAGKYALSAEMVGYSKLFIENVPIYANETRRLNFRLQKSIIEGESITVSFDTKQDERKRLFQKIVDERKNIEQATDELTNIGTLRNEAENNLGRLKKLLEVKHNSSPPTVKIISPKSNDILSDQEIKVQLKVVDNGCGISEVVLLHNDERVFDEVRGFQIVEEKKNDAFYKTYQVVLSRGQNRLTASAFDNENTESKPHTINLLLEAPRFVKGKYYALLMGVQDYEKGSGIKGLKHPVQDAEKLKQVLTNNYSFESRNVILLKNPTRADIIGKLDDLARNLQEEDNLLVFYAGHGYWDEGREQGYWLPSNASKKNRANWVSNSDIADQIKGIQAKHTLLISDACFAGAIFETRKAFDENGSVSAAYELYKDPSRRGITSGALTEVPDKSVFVEYLIKELEENKAAYFSSGKLFYEIREPVINNSPLKQKPQFGVIRKTGDEGGEFIFIHK